jgi:hypothetical protein
VSNFANNSDLVSAIQGRSKTGVVYSVSAVGATYPGFIDVLRNGTRTWSVRFPVAAGGFNSGALTDSNSGFLIDVLSYEGVPAKADPSQFVLSLN